MIVALLASARSADADTTVSPTSLSLYTGVSTPSVEGMLTIVNGQSTDVTVTSIAFSDPSYAQTAGSIPPFTLSGIGASATISITCTPQQLGPHDATATITTDVDSATAQLHCEGEPILDVTPSPLAFGLQQVGIPAYSIGATIFNSGDSALQVTGVAITGPDAADFSVPSGLVGLMLLPRAGTTAGFTETFTPSRVGDEAAELDFQTDDPSWPLTRVALTGTGFVQPFTVSTNSVDFQGVIVGGSASSMLSVTNLTSAALDVSLALSGPGAAQFSFDTSTLAIPASGSMPVVLTFSPTGYRPATATLAVSPSPLPMTVAISGFGTLADLELSPKPLDLGAWPVGQRSPAQTITLTNHSAESVVVEQIRSGDHAFVVDAALPASLASGDSMTFSVAFASNDEGPHRGDVTVYIGDTRWAVATLGVTAAGTRASQGGCDASDASSSWSSLLLGALALLHLCRRRARRLAGALMFFAACHGTPVGHTSPCATIVPTCDDGTPALVYDDFSGMCEATFAAEQPGEAMGDTWNMFGDEAGDPPTPIVAAIVNASAPPYAGTEPAAAGIAANGQFGGLAAPLGSTATWVRWTVLGVDANGPVNAVATSPDGVTWTPVATIDNIGPIFALDAGATCFQQSGHPPPPTTPCTGLSVHLDEAIFVCPGPP